MGPGMIDDLGGILVTIAIALFVAGFMAGVAVGHWLL